VNRALFAAASGMAAQQTNLDVIANNLANADVAGFKGAAATFGEISAPVHTNAMKIGHGVLPIRGNKLPGLRII